MNTHADKSRENKSHSVTNVVSQKQSRSESAFQFVDNRPEGIAQSKLQEMANNSPQAKKAAQLQAMADNFTALQQTIIQKKENNTGLPDNIKAGVENLSGYSMDDVKVHYNSDKPSLLQAHAFAQGTDIHLASGQEKHLPHEAWHVVQQKQGRVKPTMQMKGKVNINDDAGLEKEADVMGLKSLQLKGQKNESFNQNLVNSEVAQFNKMETYTQSTWGKSKDVLQQVSYSSNHLDSGKIDVSEEEKLISLAGSFNKENGESQDITATLSFKVDERDSSRVVIGNMKATPKRTGAGSILIYHLIKWASDNGKEWIGTDLSALEEGTPEFYKAIGLNPEPSPEILETIKGLYDSVRDGEMDVDVVNTQVNKILWAGRLNGKVSDMLSTARGKLVSSHWSTS